MNDPLLLQYERIYHDVLGPIAVQLQRLISDHLHGVQRIDQITARAKTPDRFIAKARSLKDGKPRYSSPFEQIQDQVGARVVVFYKSDVEPVGAILNRYLRPIETIDLVPESEWAFGYFGRHFVFALPTEAIPARIEISLAPRLFELQVKTLFQHAWSEANHDLGYNPPEDLQDDQKRRLAFTAAQAWGADRVFSELASELLNNPGAA